MSEPASAPRPQRYPALVWQWPRRLPWRFERRRLALLVVILIAMLCAAVFGWLSLPRAVRAWINLNEYRTLVAQRELLGRRYTLQVEALSNLQRRIAAGLETVTRMRQTLGLPSVNRGQRTPEVASVIPSTSIYFDLAQTKLRAQRTTDVSLRQWGSELEAVETALDVMEDQLAKAPTILPVVSERLALSSDFGRHFDPLTETTRFHNGLLIAAPRGARVVAPADGVVAFTGVFRSTRGSWQRLGRMVVVRHGERFISILGHCDRVRVSPQQQVRRGEWLADAGDSGMTTHPGVYYEVRRRDPELDGPEAWIPVDPKFFILNSPWSENGSLRNGEAPATAPEFELLPYALRRNGAS